LGGLVAALTLTALLVGRNTSGDRIASAELGGVRIIAASLNLLVDTATGTLPPVGGIRGSGVVLGAISLISVVSGLCVDAALSVSGAVRIGSAGAVAVVLFDTTHRATHLPLGVEKGYCSIALNTTILAAAVALGGIVAHSLSPEWRVLLQSEPIGSATLPRGGAISVGVVRATRASGSNDLHILDTTPWAADLSGVVINLVVGCGGTSGLAGRGGVESAATLRPTIVARASSMRGCSCSKLGGFQATRTMAGSIGVAIRIGVAPAVVK